MEDKFDLILSEINNLKQGQDRIEKRIDRIEKRLDNIDSKIAGFTNQE